MRMVSWPVGLSPKLITPTTGPTVISSSESLSMLQQVVEYPTSLVGFDLEFPPAGPGQEARAFAGLVTSLAGGANVVAWPFRDPDEPTWAERGIGIRDEFPVKPWLNGQLCSNGMPVRISPPLASFAAAASRGASVVTLDMSSWGGLTIGTRFGSVYHFGVYMVVGVSIDTMARRAEATIWPPLRADIASGEAATLRPGVAMRLARRDGGSMARGPGTMDGRSLSLIEVPHHVILSWVG